MYVFTPGPGLVSTGNVTNAALSNVANVDTVISPASLAMSGFVTHLVLTQAGLTGTANASGGSFLTSLQGGDTLVGSAAGNDTFIVAPGQPTDTITNFSLHDLVDISAFAALGLKPTFTDHGTYSTAQFTNGDTITFQGEPASLLATDASGNYIVDPPAAGPPPAPPPPAPPPPSSAPPPPPPAPPPPANTVTTSVSYTLPANGHNLTGTGSANLTLVGNALNNVITPNSGADTLTGHGGSDTFVFSPGQRAELVTDFNAHDQLDVSAYLTAGMNPSFQAHGGYTTVQFADGDTIVLLGVHASTLHLNGHYIT
jgi:Ca2+-binding RTX toxin-like protein